MANSPDESALQLRRLVLGYRVSQALGVVARLAIADFLRDGPLGIEELARLAAAKPDPLARVIRLLTGEGVFAEVAPDRFALTPMAQALRSDVNPSFRARAAFDTAGANWAAWGKLTETVRTGEPAFEHAHGTDFFDYLREHPGAARGFDAVMAEGTFFAAEAVSRAYPLPENAVVVDVGGGYGALVLTLLHDNPTITGILYDQPQVIERAHSQIVRIGLDDRCRVVGGDFFTGVVPAGGTHYFLKHILHDWNDEECITILGRCRTAMADTARLIVVEALLPPPNQPSYASALDLQMLVMLRGRERRVEDYARLFAAADLQLTQVVATNGDFSLVEARTA